MSDHRPTVFVSAGTYHLPFTRLIEWIERWAERHPEARVVVQHGPTRPVGGAENAAMLPYPELMAHCRTADVVVLQGGAGGIMDLRGIGRRPIVVPRIPVDDEVVDDHQLRFAERAEGFGLIHCALDEATLHRLIDETLAGRVETRVSSAVEVPGVARVAELLSAPPASVSGGERLRRLRRSVVGILRDRRR